MSSEKCQRKAKCMFVVVFMALFLPSEEIPIDVRFLVCTPLPLWKNLWELKRGLKFLSIFMRCWNFSFFKYLLEIWYMGWWVIVFFTLSRRLFLYHWGFFVNCGAGMSGEKNIIASILFSSQQLEALLYQQLEF